MSLIFQSLQRLKSNLNHSPSGFEEAAPPHDTEPAKPLFKIRTVSISLVVVLALGCGTVYAVQVLKQRISGDDHLTIQKQRHAIPHKKAFASEWAPEAQNDGNLHNAVSQQVTQRTPEVQTRFYPPEQKGGAVNPVPGTQSQDQSLQPPVATASVPMPLTQKPKPHSVAAQSVSDAAMEAAERARRAALEKSARMARLVRKLEQAMAGAPDAGNPQALLDQLARIKGETHPYVMKMRAYWNFKRGRYNEAEAALEKVVAIHPDDLEAGINLALIEIQDERYGDAMARLKRLRQTYPDHPQVADLIERLK